MENKNIAGLVVIFDGTSGQYLRDSYIDMREVKFSKNYIEIDNGYCIKEKNIVEVLLFIPICTHNTRMVLESVLKNITSDKGCSYNHSIVWTDYIQYPCHLIRIRKNGKEIKYIKFGSNTIHNNNSKIDKTVTPLNLDRVFNSKHERCSDIISKWEVPQIYTDSQGYRYYSDMNHDTEIDLLNRRNKYDLFSISLKYRPITSKVWIIKESDVYKMSSGQMLVPLEHLASIERDGFRYIFTFNKPIVRINQNLRRDFSLIYKEKLTCLEDGFEKDIGMDFTNTYIGIYDLMMLSYEYGKLLKPAVIKELLKSRFRYNL